MRRFLQTASLYLVAPALLSLSACSTPYSQTYSYQKTPFKVVTLKDGTRVLQKGYVFEPYEQQAQARAEIDKEKREAERMRLAAQRSEKMSADKIGADSASLKMDSGLGGGLSGASSIPGLDSPAAAPAMSGGGIPGLDSGASMGGASMGGASMGGASMGGASMGGASMEGAGTMAPAGGMAPAPTAPKPGAPAMLPGL
jgi:hypothetical protein